MGGGGVAVGVRAAGLEGGERAGLARTNASVARCWDGLR